MPLFRVRRKVATFETFDVVAIAEDDAKEKVAKGGGTLVVGRPSDRVIDDVTVVSIAAPRAVIIPDTTAGEMYPMIDRCPCCKMLLTATDLVYAVGDRIPESTDDLADGEHLGWKCRECGGLFTTQCINDSDAFDLLWNIIDDMKNILRKRTMRGVNLTCDVVEDRT